MLPWIIGLIVFALLAWGITVLLDGDQLEEDPIPAPRSQLEERSGASLAWRPAGTEVLKKGYRERYPRCPSPSVRWPA